jgi:uncharacterized protein DUF1638
MFLKVIACEIALREICFTAARSPNLVDLEFLAQGHHDNPRAGQAEIQKRINALPAQRYDAIVLGYGLCSSILAGLTTRHTQLVIPRAHDCITLFLGSKERYQSCFSESPGTYYFTSGWLECMKRRGHNGGIAHRALLPAGPGLNLSGAYQGWVEKYGEEQAKYLLEEMSRWTEAYSTGTLIDFDFLGHLGLRDQVEQICRQKKWRYNQLAGDLDLFQKLLDGNWPETDFLVVQPGQKVAASFDAGIIKVV